jgi:hypothetical protein
VPSETPSTTKTAEVVLAAPPPKPIKPKHPGLTVHDETKGYVRPHRDAVVHVRGAQRCPVTILRPDHADFHARTPGVLDRVTCTTCRREFPASEFVWHGSDEVVGT